jgi:uncharacterized protein with PQ loop repeat
MTIGLHHHRRKKPIQHKHTTQTRWQKIVDELVYIFGIFSVVVYIPQLMKIWIDKSTSGVSVLSWIGLLMGTLFWFIYGLIHKEKPIIFINLFIGLTQLLIILGVLLYS